MWEVQMKWCDRWVIVAGGYHSRDDAEWAIGLWKQANNCTGDPFRAVEGDSKK